MPSPSSSANSLLPADPLAQLANLLDPPRPANLDESDWQAWLLAIAPHYCFAPFGPHHEEFWAWAWSIRPGVRPDPLVAVWPRGGAKSTSAELAVVALAARRVRRYGWYISEIQDQADDHVSNVGALLESRTIEEHYPLLAQRRVGKYGSSKGWRVNRLRTAAGFTLDAVGLDTAARGVKLEEQRPDFFVVDDIDSESDSTDKVDKKIRILTRRLMPAGSVDLAVLAVQNLVHENSVFAQLVDGRAEMLADRKVIGPIPAVRGLVTEKVAQDDGTSRYRIVAGEPTWAGQDLATCEKQINDWGLPAFNSEAQHDTAPPPGGMFDHVEFRRIPWELIPWTNIVRTVVWVDPAVTDKDSSDAMGISAAAIDEAGIVYRLYSWEQRSTVTKVLEHAIEIAYLLGAEKVGVETDQGGDTWEVVYTAALTAVLEENPQWVDQPAPRFDEAKAGAGHGSKAHRASKMVHPYDRGEIIHVIGENPATSTHHLLERALRRFPKTKPLDLVDASYWSWYDLTEAEAEGMYEEYDEIRISPY